MTNLPRPRRSRSEHADTVSAALAGGEGKSLHPIRSPFENYTGEKRKMTIQELKTVIEKYDGAKSLENKTALIAALQEKMAERNPEKTTRAFIAGGLRYELTHSGLTCCPVGEPLD